MVAEAFITIYRLIAFSFASLMRFFFENWRSSFRFILVTGVKMSYHGKEHDKEREMAVEVEACLFQRQLQRPYRFIGL